MTGQFLYSPISRSCGIDVLSDQCTVVELLLKRTGEFVSIFSVFITENERDGETQEPGIFLPSGSRRVAT